MATFNSIVNHSYDRRDELHEEKNKYFKIIYKSVLNHESLREIHKKLYKAIINPNKRLLQFSFYVAQRAHKLDKGKNAYYGTGLAVLANSLMNLMIKNTYVDKVINRIVVEEQTKEKEVFLDDLFKEGRATGKIFYVASSHEDCAEDHKPYQGKIYVDAYYDRHNKELCDYVRSHNIKTVQWVTGKPAYFITRPNCRHYFLQKTFDEIKGGVDIPHSKIGYRRYQTPADVSLVYYKRRLNLLIDLQKQYDTEEIRIKITKTKILINKWKNS